MKPPKLFVCALTLAIGSAAMMLGSTAMGGTVPAASSAAYGVQLAGPVPIEATPEVSASIQTGESTDNILEVPADPLATSFTASVTADAVRNSKLDMTLQSVMIDASPGSPSKWNSRGHAITEDLEAVTDTIMADVIESESVAACDGTTNVFGSAARIVNLSVAGTPVVLPPPTPNQVLLDQAGIRIIFWETNWDPATGGTTDGSSTVFTNGVHVTAPGGIDLIVSHSEATAACTAAQPAADAECEDGKDNNDPEDSLADEEDPGCHTDGDAANSSSYDPNDNDERDDADDSAPPASAVDGDPTFTG